MTDDFTPDLPNENTPPTPPTGARDGSYVDPMIIPPPQQVRTAAPLSVPFCRRALKAALEATKIAMATLTKLERGEKAQLNAIAVDALVCAATDRQFPLDDSDPNVERQRKQARQGQFFRYLSLAMDELEDVLATLVAALAAPWIKLVSNTTISYSHGGAASGSEVWRRRARGIAASTGTVGRFHQPQAQASPG